MNLGIARLFARARRRPGRTWAITLSTGDAPGAWDRIDAALTDDLVSFLASAEGAAMLARAHTAPFCELTLSERR